jgi:hypothetical protein
MTSKNVVSSRTTKLGICLRRQQKETRKGDECKDKAVEGRMKKAVVGAGLRLCPKSGNTRGVGRERKLWGEKRY